MPGDAHLSGSKVSNVSGHDCSVGCSPILCTRGSSMLSGSFRQGERKQTDLNEHQPTDTHMMYHTGQYLFFIAISTGSATLGVEWRYRDKQPESWDVVSTIT